MRYAIVQMLCSIVVCEIGCEVTVTQTPFRFAARISEAKEYSN